MQLLQVKSQQIQFGLLRFLNGVKQINHTDNYGFTVAKAREFFSGEYLEQAGETRHKTSFQEIKKTMFFYKTSVVYPLVNFEKNKNLYSISQIDCCDIISYTERFGMMAP